VAFGSSGTVMSGSYEPELNLVYWTTGNPWPDMSGRIRKGDNLYTCSVLALDADTGKLLWEHRFNIYQSDVPAHRVGWASPAADVETGNVYVFGVNGTLLALTKDGKLLWERSLDEEFDLFTTHGGRTTSPVVAAVGIGGCGLVSCVSTKRTRRDAAAARMMARLSASERSVCTCGSAAPGTDGRIGSAPVAISRASKSRLVPSARARKADNPPADFAHSSASR